MELVLRPANEADGRLLFAIYAATRQEELAVTGWSDAEKTAFLTAQFAAQSEAYSRYPGATFSVVLVDGVGAGRLYVARWPGEIRIMDIALLPEYRGQGIGGRLLEQVIAESRSAGLQLTIHVERNNRARYLYFRLGFTLAEDKGVYLLLSRPAS
jgi:ribosomal protein S18 acetylase RimI-like enzyme